MSSPRTAEEWGRLAVSLPGWRWMHGMQMLPLPNPGLPDPDDPATAGCLLALLGPVQEAVWYTGDCDRWVVAVGEERRLYTSLGRACIAAAAALGRWPNVAECGPKGAE